jgi:hypothetical protein
MSRLRLASVVAIAVSFVIASPTAAGAHVTIDPDTASAGGSAILHFRYRTNPTPRAQ